MKSNPSIKEQIRSAVSIASKAHWSQKEEEIDQATEAILKIIESEVIGENEERERIHVSHYEHTVHCIPQLNLWARDNLRESQRELLK